MSPITEDEIETYLRVKGKLEDVAKLEAGWPTTVEGPLCTTLDKLACYPFIKMPFSHFDDTDSCHFAISGEDAGTLMNPNLNMILQKSTVSSFGKGEEWITDLAYRNGREIDGEFITYKWPTTWIMDSLSHKITKAMFIGREVSLKLHKLAIYSTGGHFDWHLDATHGKQHQATMLLALKTSWEGGDFLIRRKGVETRVDMKPEQTISDSDSPKLALQAIAFYTDTEHKVEPVTDGVRIVLQFDVLVKEEEGGGKGEEEEEEEEEAIEVDEETGWETSEDMILLDAVDDRAIRDSFRDYAPVSADQKIIERVVAMVKTKLESGFYAVGLALQYLHRKASIRPEYLKGPDASLYRMLVETKLFDVVLLPVVLIQVTNDDGGYGGNEGTTTVYAYRSNSADMKTDSGSQAVDDSASWVYKIQGEPVDCKRLHPPETMSRENPRIFHVNSGSALTLLDTEDFIEHRGNSPEQGVDKYIGGGIFVRFKRDVKKTEDT